MIEYALPGEQLQTSPEFKQGMETAGNMQQQKNNKNSATKTHEIDYKAGQMHREELSAPGRCLKHPKYGFWI